MGQYYIAIGSDCREHLGTYGYINGLTQKEVSDKFVSLITPSPSHSEYGA